MTAQETSAKENNTDVKQTATTPVLIYQSRQHCLYINFKNDSWLLLAAFAYLFIVYFLKFITYTILLFHRPIP